MVTDRQTDRHNQLLNPGCAHAVWGDNPEVMTVTLVYREEVGGEETKKGESKNRTLVEMLMCKKTVFLQQETVCDK